MRLRVIKSFPFQQDREGNTLAVILDTNGLCYRLSVVFKAYYGVKQVGLMSAYQQLGYAQEDFDKLIATAKEKGWNPVYADAIPGDGTEQEVSSGDEA